MICSKITRLKLRGCENETDNLFHDDKYPDCIKWQSPIYMPRKVARLFLSVKDVWREQLQDITEDDAMAEAAPNQRMQEFYLGIRPRTIKTLVECTYRQGFAELWVIEFEKMEVGGDK